MGQKTHPIGFRLGITRGWDSTWYSEKSFAGNISADMLIRRIIRKELAHAGVGSLQIERKGKKVKVHINAARPGIIIGKKGKEVERLKDKLQKVMPDSELVLNIKEERRPELSAQLIADNVALQLERRVAFRRAMKKSVFTAMRFNAKGIRINCSGRLGGAEIARREWYREGRVPLHTLRADLDYGFAEATTTFGIIGVKVWVYRGDIYFGRAAKKLEEQRKVRSQKHIEEVVEAVKADMTSDVDSSAETDKQTNND